MSAPLIKAPDWALKQAGVQQQPAAQEPAAAAAVVGKPTLVQPPAWAVQAAHSNIAYVGGVDLARQAMWPEQSAPNEVDRPNVFMRGVRGIANGIAQMIPASMTLAGGIIDFMGADEAGHGLAEKGIDLQTWLNEHVAVENPTFYDHFMTGVGSLASFLVPGMGAAGLAGKVGQAAGLAGKAAKTFQALTGGGLMSFLEAGVEQSQRQQELMGQGMTAQQALDASQPVFWHNVGLLMATNIAEFWLPMPASVKNKAIARIGAAVKNAFVEGGQERAQGVIQDVVAGRGEWADFFDPAKYQTETAVGALTGGLAGAVLPGDEADPAQPPATPPASGQKPATGPAAPIPPGGPTAVAAPPPSPPAPQKAAPQPQRPVAPAAVPEGMEPPSDRFVPYDEDEEAARGPQAPPPEEDLRLTRTPAEMEMPPETEDKPFVRRNKGWNSAENESLGATNAKRLRGLVGAEEAANELQDVLPGVKASDLIATAREYHHVGDDITEVPFFDVTALRLALAGDEAALERHVEEQALRDGQMSTDADQYISDAEDLANLVRTGSKFPSAPAAEPAPEPVQSQPGPEIVQEAPAQEPAPAPKPKRETAKERRARERAELDEVNAEARRRMEAAGRPVEDEPAAAPEVLDKNAVVDPEYADPEAAADVRRLERKVEDNKRKLADIRAGKLPHLDIGEAERALKGSGMRLAAARRRLTGALTEIERAAEDKRRASNHVGKPVTVNTTTGPVNGVIAAPPAFGKVRVKLEDGKVISAAPGNVTARAVAPPQPEAAPHGRWTVHMVNIADITERPEDMQNRDAAASQKTIDAIRDNYNEIDMEPIKLWRDPSSGDLVTIQGHSRTEGFRQRGETKIPAFIIEGASFEEARRAALEGNFKGDQGSVLDKVKGLRMQAEADGLTPAEIADKAKDLHGKNAPTIIAMMHLNPNGRVIEAVRSMLGAEEVGDSGSSLTKIAKWIGEARRRNQNLTDAHEGEMFDVLRDEMAKKVKKPWASREVDFQKHVRGLATAGGFDASKPLNLGLDKRTPAEKKFDADLAAAQEAVDRAQAAHDEKAAELAAKGIAADVQDQILKKYRADIVIAKTELSVIDGSRERYLQAERDQGGLFRVSGQKPDYRSLAKAAADSGLTPPIKASPRDLVDQMAIRVAKMFGIANVEFVTGLKSKDGQMAHGYYQPQTNTVFLNIESPEPMLTILMHEVGHRMQVQHPDLWAELQQLLASRQTERGKNVYTSNAVAVRGYRPSDVENEWVADGLMEAATSPLFWAEVKQRNPHLAGKLIDMIVDALRAIRKMFARSGASVDVYYDNFGAIIQQVGKVAAEMVAREDAKQLLSRETTDQLEMFKKGDTGLVTKIAEWFAGTGTLHAALRGVTSVHMVEYSPAISGQYNEAFGTSYAPQDVTQVDPKQVADSGADHFHASPVCKNFSKAKRARDTSDLDIASAQAVARVVREAGIPSITVENVQDYKDTEPYRIITEALKDSGYKWDVVVHDAADYGANQHRKRLIIRAVKSGELPPLPAKTGPSDWFASIEDLLPSAEKSTVDAERARGRGWNWEPNRIANMVKNGELDPSLPIITMGGSTDKVRAWAANSGGAAPTIKATERETIRIIMPDGTVYRATPRMMARLMGLPDTFTIPEDYGFAKKVLGNGIHGAVTRAIIQPLIDTAPLRAGDEIGSFRRGPASSSEMEELNKKLDAAYKRAGTRRHTSTWSGFGRHLYYLLMDKNTCLYKAVSNTMKAAGRTVDFARNPYTAIQHFNKWISGAEVAVKYEIRSFDDKTVLSEGLEPIIRRFKLADAIDSGEFGHFWKAATLVSRRWKIGDSFFGDDPTSDIYQERAAAYQKWQDLYDKYSKSHPNWVKAVDALTTFAYARVERAFQAGIIDVDQRDYLTKTYSVYAPLMRLNDEAYNIDRGDVTGAGTLAHEMKVFDHTAEYMDPVDAIIKQTYHMEYFLRSNEARIKLADFIRSYRDNPKGVVSAKGIGYRVKPKADPVHMRVRTLLQAAGLDPDTIDYLDTEGLADLEASAKIYVTATFQEDGVVALMRNGEIEYWKLEPDIYDVYASTQGNAEHDMMKFFTAQTNLLRAGAVLTPDFISRNIFKDFVSSTIISQSMVGVKWVGPVPIINPAEPLFVVPYRIFKALGSIIKRDADFIEFMYEVGHGELLAQDQKNLPKATRELTASARGKASKVKYMLHGHPLTVLQELSKMSEQAPRLAVYKKTKADAIAAGFGEEEARARGAIQGRESSIDFSRSGAYGRVINKIIPFFNAAVQGNDKAIRTFLTDPTGKKDAWARGVYMLTVPSVMLWLLNHDQDWYDDQPQWLKNNFWLFSFDGGKTIHKLAKPYELGLTYASFAERVLDWLVKKDPDAMRSWARATTANLFAVNEKNPLASAGALAGPMVGSAIETITNYDAYRGSPIVKGWLEEVAPREQYNASTSEFAKLMGGIAPGAGLSPMMIDHFIRGSFGGIGAYATEIASNIIMFADSDIRQAKPSSRLIYDAVPDWMPVVKSVTQTTPMGYTRQISEFYEIYDETREAVKTMQAFKSAGAPREKFEALYRRAGVQLSMSKPVMATSEALGAISKQMRMIESAPATVMSRDEKRKKLDELAANRNQIVDGFMKQYRAVDTKQIQREIDASLDALGRQYEGMRR